MEYYSQHTLLKISLQSLWKSFHKKTTCKRSSPRKFFPSPKRPKRLPLYPAPPALMFLFFREKMTLFKFRRTSFYRSLHINSLHTQNVYASYLSHPKPQQIFPGSVKCRSGTRLGSFILGIISRYNFCPNRHTQFSNIPPDRNFGRISKFLSCGWASGPRSLNDWGRIWLRCISSHNNKTSTKWCICHHHDHYHQVRDLWERWRFQGTFHGRYRVAGRGQQQMFVRGCWWIDRHQLHEYPSIPSAWTCLQEDISS